MKDLPGIEITERHEHSNDVPYIEKGLDAAVVYGVQDLKFINNNNYSITLEVSATEDNITVNVKK